MKPLDVLTEAVRAQAIPARQIAGDCLSIDLPTFLTLVSDLEGGRLKVEHGQVVQDYRHQPKRARR